jgi:predicted MFS family arabinose efflux permease
VLVLLILWLNRASLLDDVQARRDESEASHLASNPGGAPMSTFGFLKLPMVWLCWIFLFLSMAATTGLQSFAPTALFKIYDIAVSSGNYYLTLMSLGGAGGMLLGGYLAAKLKVPERIITICFTLNIVLGLLMATGLVPVELIVIAFTVIGLGLGIAAPSRDLIIRSATPSRSSGRVYGIVYSGIDLGAALSPLIFGIFLDIGLPKLLFVGVAFMQLMLILAGFKLVAVTSAKAR